MAKVLPYPRRSTLSAAPIRATIVKSAYEPGPVTTCCRRAGLTVLLDLPRSCPGSAAARPGSSWSARSRAAARTNELDAGKRREILEGEEGFLCGWLIWGRVLVPGAWRAEWSRKPPSGVALVRGCHDHVSGTGLLSQMIERGLAAVSCR